VSDATHHPLVDPTAYASALPGRVETFDAAVGLGVVAAGTRRYRFHCTAIADGTREIDPGTTVLFRRVAGHGGEIEAIDLVAA
jgi:cold shock CspA family protein